MTRRGEDGAVAVLLAIILLVLISMVALVLDLGLLRMDRRDDQRTADVAAAAGAMTMATGTPEAGCLAAWEYFEENTPDAPSVPDPDCNPLPAWSTLACALSPLPGPTTVERQAGPYTVGITWPVDDTHQLMDGREDGEDGEPCERIGVSITRDRSFAFAGVMGHDEGSSLADAVGRAGFGEDAGLISSLVVLDPEGCSTLNRVGGGSIHVRETTSPDPAPGIITVDSNARNCSGGNRVIDPHNGQSIRAGGTDGSDTDKLDDNGRIFSYALSGPWASDAYDASDVPVNLSPAPESIDERLTRAPVDERYNTDDPDTGPDEAHIDELESEYGGAGAPAGFDTYGNDPGEKCTVSGNVTLTGDWFIDCPTLLINGGTFRIGPGDVVVRGGIKLSGGTLSVNDDGTQPTCDTGYDPSAPHVLYLRGGDLDVGSSGSRLCLPEVFVHLETGSLKMTGADALRWVAPDDDTYRFDDLAMWAESDAEFSMAGQAGMELEGVWFAPNAGASKPNGDFSFAGGSASDQQKAQFWTWRFTAEGGGNLVMTPDPDRNIESTFLGIWLIR